MFDYVVIDVDLYFDYVFVNISGELVKYLIYNIVILGRLICKYVFLNDIEVIGK